jgi:signal recognition particle subunit SRP54
MTPSIAEFRKLLLRGRDGVNAILQPAGSMAPELSALICDAKSQYRRMLGILDSMTPAERDSPLEQIDSERIRRISLGSGTKDQEVLQLLFNFREYCQTVLKAKTHMKR